jgi:hypothetical protein
MYEKGKPGEAHTQTREFYGVWIKNIDGDEFWACDWATVKLGLKPTQVPLVTFCPERKALEPLRKTWLRQSFVVSAEILLVKIPGPELQPRAMPAPESAPEQEPKPTNDPANPEEVDNGN